MLHLLLVALASLIAGAVNAVAGGGTFLAFPALTQWGALSEKLANIACTIGLWPGSASAVLAVRRELRDLPRGMLIGYTAVCLVGGVVGSLLLLHTSETTFHYAIPWLLLFATAVFAAGPWVSKLARRHSADQTHRGPTPIWVFTMGLVQFIVAIYGGYFGAGIGVLTLAGLSIVGLKDLRQTNVMKVAMSTATNLTAAIVFLFGPVPWTFVAVMAVASTVGGFGGMTLAQRVPQLILRSMILTVAILLTAAYFWLVYFH